MDEILTMAEAAEILKLSERQVYELTRRRSQERTVGTDKNIGLLQLIDTSTGNPVSAAVRSLVISPDGTKAAFDMLTPDALNPGNYVSNIYIANVDATGQLTQLTYDNQAIYPQFSADGTKIVYVTQAGGHLRHECRRKRTAPDLDLCKYRRLGLLGDFLTGWFEDRRGT